MTQAEETNRAGAAVYTRVNLATYDLVVLLIANHLIWRCPTSKITTFYNNWVSDEHLDVGVGTGYFLDKCKFGSAQPRVTLVDLNPNSLQAAATRIKRYKPRTVQADVLKPLTISERFRSAGLSYLLHCLPGTMSSKAVVFDNVKQLMQPGGVIFGTTILNDPQHSNTLAHLRMENYNQRRIFSNQVDTAAELEKALTKSFKSHELTVVGCVAFFVGRV